MLNSLVLFTIIVIQLLCFGNTLFAYTGPTCTDHAKVETELNPTQYNLYACTGFMQKSDASKKLSKHEAYFRFQYIFFGVALYTRRSSIMFS